MHKFPKRENIRKQWLEACGLAFTDNISNTVICSNHFKQMDYRCYRKKQLKYGSVPSINVSNLPALQNKKNEITTNSDDENLFESEPSDIPNPNSKKTYFCRTTLCI
ncbi:uncharacterized protein LOC114255095 [Monomorium pharaonis]|uniref:uncharacterized protein LOC114255095 n=1 Tax=Monomorium pharaonis TaxID=307658 RepID=UPI00102E11BB|nr:uncharacterized protein LOC114255095 [Monomorium pharaonis]